MVATVKILVVDDEPLLQSLIEQNFEMQVMNNELHFVFASNGAEALEKLKADDTIGVILTDINMPVMDGLTLLGKMAELKPLYRSVVVSAYGDMKNIRTAMNRGASDFVTKPIDLNDLEITIKKTLEQYHDLHHADKAKKEVAEFYKELEIARNIQSLFIPTEFNPFPNSQNVAVYGRMIPAKEVGGDFFDFMVLDPTHLAVVIADVSGKGIPAALFMAMSLTLIRGVAPNEPSPADCMKRVNHLLCYKNDTCMFVTTFYGIIDITTGEFNYCNAGHNPPYVLSSDGSLTKIGDIAGMALGIFDETAATATSPVSFYEKITMTLKKGDTLILYTDGVTEAANHKFDFYGESRLEEFLKANAGKSVNELTDALKKDVEKFVEGAQQSDDITILALRYNGP